MYYYQPPKNYTPPTQPNYAQVQNWDQQRGRDEAMDWAGQYFKGQGWDPVNAQQYGNNFKVHLCDRNGQYHTVTMDGNGHVLQNQNGYQ